MQTLFLQTVKYSFFLILGSLLLQSCDGVQNGEESVSRAKQYIEQNNLREAGLELRNALQTKPSNGEARYLLGNLNVRIGDMATAEKEFRRAEQAGWKPALSRTGLLRALIGMHEFSEAEAAASVDETFSAEEQANLYALLAFTQAATDRTELAEQTLEKAEQLDVNAVYVLKTRAQLSYNQGRVDKGIGEINQALERYPGNVELMSVYAYGALLQNDEQAARKIFQQIIDKEPDNLVTYYGRSARLGLARIEILTENFDIADKLLQPLLKQSPEDAEANYIRALLQVKKNDLDLAEESLLKVLKLFPDHGKTLLLYGAVHFSRQELEQAAYYLAKYLQQSPENTGARKLLGQIYILMGQHDEAEATLQPAMQKPGTDAELLALVGLSRLQGGDVEAGISGLESAVQASPRSQILRSNLARAYITAGETENAIAQLNEILASGKDVEQALALKVSAYLQAEQYEQAINQALEIVQHAPDNPAALTLAGNVFAASGDRAEARKYFNRALKINSQYPLALMLLATLEELDGNNQRARQLYLQITRDNDSIDPLLALARLDSRLGNTDEMLNWLEEARNRDARDTRSRLVLAEYYIRENNSSKLEQISEEMLEIAPADARTLALQARVLMLKQKFSEALKPLNKLVIKEPSASMARVLLAETYLRLNQISDARTQINHALKLDEFDLVTLQLAAAIDLVEKNYDSAIHHSNTIQRLNPELSIGYELEADARFELKDYATAGRIYKKALDIEATSKRVTRFAQTLMAQGKLGESKLPLTGWLATHPDDVAALQLLGSVQQTLKEDKQAIKTFEKLLLVQPDDVISLNNLAWMYNQSSNPRALELAEKVYRLQPENAGIKDTYGWVLVSQGHAEKGLRVLKQAYQALPEVPDVQYHYAVALLKTGNKARAKQMLISLLEKHESFSDRGEAQALLQSL